MAEQSERGPGFSKRADMTCTIPERDFPGAAGCSGAVWIPALGALKRDPTSLFAHVRPGSSATEVLSGLASQPGHSVTRSPRLCAGFVCQLGDHTHLPCRETVVGIWVTDSPWTDVGVGGAHGSRLVPAPGGTSWTRIPLGRGGRRHPALR